MSHYNKDELETKITATKRAFLIDPQQVDKETLKTKACVCLHQIERR